MKEKSPVVHWCDELPVELFLGVNVISTSVLLFMDVVTVPLTCTQLSTQDQTIVTEIQTFAIHICVQVELCDVVGRRRFDPDAFPDATTWRVENVRGMQRLFPDGHIVRIHISWVEREYQTANILASHPKSFRELLTVRWCHYSTAGR